VKNYPPNPILIPFSFFSISQKSVWIPATKGTMLQPLSLSQNSYFPRTSLVGLHPLSEASRYATGCPHRVHGGWNWSVVWVAVAPDHTLPSSAWDATTPCAGAIEEKTYRRSDTDGNWAGQGWVERPCPQIWNPKLKLNPTLNPMGTQNPIGQDRHIALKFAH
jgi:hypothetical protein